MTGAERVRRAAWTLALSISRTMPPGLPWIYVADWVSHATRAWEAALEEWRAEDTEDTRRRVWVAGGALRRAWTLSRDAWERDGRPTEEELEAAYLRDERLGMMTDATGATDAHTGEGAS